MTWESMLGVKGCPALDVYKKQFGRITSAPRCRSGVDKNITIHSLQFSGCKRGKNGGRA